MTDDELFDDANLFGACEECNLGIKTKSLTPHIMARLVLARIRRGT
jgi:hypothetical protein